MNIPTPYEVEAISRIPIAHDNSHDARYWKFEKKGNYIVKLGYWNGLTLAHHLDPMDYVGPSNNLDGIWSRIWNLPLPLKSKFSSGK